MKPKIDSNALYFKLKTVDTPQKNYRYEMLAISNYDQ